MEQIQQIRNELLEELSQLSDPTAILKSKNQGIYKNYSNFAKRAKRAFWRES